MIYTHFEFLVPLQDLRAQRKVVHRALVIVVNDVAFPVLGPVRSGLCPRLALTLIRGRRARRPGQLYALSRKTRPITSAIHQIYNQGEGEQQQQQKTHCMDPKAGLRGDHEHASRLRMHVVARVLGHEHPALPINILRHLAKGEKRESWG